MGYLKEKIGSIQFRSDKVIWILVMLFAMVSVVAIFSSSTYRANVANVSKMKFFTDQIKFVGMGLGVLIFCYFIPLKWYRILSPAIYLASLALLVLALVGGKNINGAQRTVNLLGINFQVLEFAKIGLIFYLAKAFERWSDSLDSWKDYFLKLLLPIGITCLLVLPNSASSVILFGGLSMLILFFMGVKWKYIVVTILAALAALALLFGIYALAFGGKQQKPKAEQNKVEKIFNRFGSSQHRIESFLDEIQGKSVDITALSEAEYQEYLDNNRQSLNAKIAISEGKIFGKGPGKSTSRYSLSMAFSDFIYAFIVEEYGLLGGIFILMLYTVFLFRGIRIAQKCSTPFPQTLSLGITWLVAIQAMLHIFVNIRLIPITGHTLPFISHGGTAFLIFSGAVGVLLSVSKQVNIQSQAAQNEEETQEYEEFESDN